MNQRDHLRREKEARIAAQKALEAEQRQAWVDAYLKWGPGHFGNPDQTLLIVFLLFTFIVLSFFSKVDQGCQCTGLFSKTHLNKLHSLKPVHFTALSSTRKPVETGLKTTGGPPPEPLSQEEINRVKDVRAKLYWIYRPRNPRECQVLIICVLKNQSGTRGLLLY